MEIGLKLPQFGSGTTPDLMLRWAQFAETAGFHFILTGDHIALTPEVLRGYPPPYYEPFTTMAWLAAKTQRIRLGFTVVVVPYRHPALLAHLTSTLDQLSEAVARRNELGLDDKIELEASGGVDLDTICAIAKTGVDRISVGALTHSAVALDISLDRI